MKVIGHINFKKCTWNNPQRLGKGLDGVVNRRTNGDHPNYSIVKIGQNTEKSPGDLQRFGVSLAPLKDH